MGPKKRMLGLATPILAMALAVGEASGANAGKADACDEWDGSLVVTDLPLQEPKGNGQEHLPVIQRASKPVKQDELEFRIFSDSIWPLPARTGKSAPEAQLPTGVTPVRCQL